MHALMLVPLLLLATPAVAAPEPDTSARAPQDQSAPVRRTQRLKPQTGAPCLTCGRQLSGPAQTVETPVAGLLMIPASFLPDANG